MKSLSYQAFVSLDHLRKELGLDVPEIATLLGVGRTAYYRLLKNAERGTSVLAYEVDVKVQVVLAVLGEFALRPQLTLQQVSDPFVHNTAIRAKHIKKLNSEVSKFKTDADTRMYMLYNLEGCIHTAQHFEAARRPVKTKAKKSA